MDDVHEMITDPNGQTRLRLACLRCQRRKIKCDRNYPCQHCSKGNLTCTQGVRKRPIGRPNRQVELNNRLERLEGLLQDMKSSGHHEQDDPGAPVSTHHAVDPASPSNKYIASGFWNSVAGEVQAMRDALDNSDADDGLECEATPDHSPYDQQQNLASGFDTMIDFILVRPGRIHTLPGALPQLDPNLQVDMYLFYIQRVDVAWKIFHVPTLGAFMRDHQPYLGHSSTEPCCEALRNMLYFGGLSHVHDDEFMRTYQRPRAAFLADFRRVAEASLIQADILHSKALPTLQALVVYIAALRKLDPGHASWSLLGLVVRLAQALNLDRESPDESFFQSQIRRRLWHHICVLDSFFAYDRGSEYLVGPGLLSRPLPTNLNDDDFDETSHASNVRARQGEFTDMNFALYQQEIFLEGHRRNLATTLEASSIESRIATMKNRHKELEQSYMAHCDANIPFQRLTIRIGRLSADMSILTTARPFASFTPNRLLPIDTPWIVEMALDVLRQTDELYKDTDVVQWVRRLDWTQWHPLVIVLSHLCSVRDTPEAENAWELVDRVMSYACLHIADTTAGKLWRPLEMLYRKAQNFRLGLQPDSALLTKPQLPGNLATGVDQAGLMPFVDQSEDFFATNQWFNLQVASGEPWI